MAILLQFTSWKFIAEGSGSHFRGLWQEEDGNLWTWSCWFDLCKQPFRSPEWQGFCPARQAHRSEESPLCVSRTLVCDTCFQAHPLKGHQELQGLGAPHRALETNPRGKLSAENTCHLFPTGIPPPHWLEKRPVGNPFFGYKGGVRV